jgi:hypothetical protein
MRYARKLDSANPAKSEALAQYHSGTRPFLPLAFSGSTKFCCKNFSPVASECCAHDYHAAWNPN